MDEAVIPPGAVFIPTKHVAFVWPMVRQFVEEFLEYMEGEFTVEDVRDQLLTGRFQLFVAWDQCVKGIIVTEIMLYPQKRTLRGYLIYGTDMDNWMAPMQRKLLEFKEHMKCAHIETICRPGLFKKLKPMGWELKQVLIVHRSF